MDEDDRRQRRERSEELNRREMYRKSRDTIRIFNPLAIQFRFMHDSFWHTIPAKGTKDVERYLADLYFRKIAQHIIGEMGIKQGEALLVKRKKSGQPDYLDKYAENREIWDKSPRMDNSELLQKIKEDVILGLVEEYGMELPEELPNQPRIDTRDVYEKILSQDKRIPLEEKPLVEEISAD